MDKSQIIFLSLPSSLITVKFTPTFTLSILLFLFSHWRMMIMLSVVRLRKFFPKDWSLFSASESHGNNIHNVCVVLYDFTNLFNYDYYDLCWHHCYINLLSLHLKSVLEDEYWETLHLVNSNFIIDLLLHRQLFIYLFLLTLFRALIFRRFLVCEI